MVSKNTTVGSAFLFSHMHFHLNVKRFNCGIDLFRLGGFFLFHFRRRYHASVSMYMPVLCYPVCCFTMDTKIFHCRGSHGYLRDNSSSVSWFLYKPWIEGKLYSDQLKVEMKNWLTQGYQRCMHCTCNQQLSKNTILNVQATLLSC